MANLGSFLGQKSVLFYIFDHILDQKTSLNLPFLEKKSHKKAILEKSSDDNEI